MIKNISHHYKKECHILFLNLLNNNELKKRKMDYIKNLIKLYEEKLKINEILMSEFLK